MERLTGIGVSPAVAVGRAVVLTQPSQVVRFPIPPDRVEREVTLHGDVAELLKEGNWGGAEYMLGRPLTDEEKLSRKQLSQSELIKVAKDAKDEIIASLPNNKQLSQSEPIKAAKDAMIASISALPNVVEPWQGEEEEEE